MANPAITFFPYTGYTVPVISVYSDQTSLLTSANASRQNYSVLTDVYINGNDVATLKSYPLNGIMQVNPQKTAENYLLHDFNYNCVGAQDNPDSIKRIGTVNSESFSRSISFSSITNTWGAATLNLLSTTTLVAGDRIYINLDNTAINPQYNTYAKVLNVTGNLVETDLPFVSVPQIETGTIEEGVEYYDYAYVGGYVAAITTQPHNLNVGDTVYIQMDTVSTGKFKLNAGTTGTISAINVGSTNILLSPVPFTSSIAGTIAALASEINANWTVTGFQAYQYGTSDILHIYSLRSTGQQTTGLPITLTNSGDLSFAYSPAMFSDNRVDAATGEGWNPQFTGTYPVTAVESPVNFTIPIPSGYNNEPGSQRGSIISMNNYVLTGGSTGQTYWIMNNRNPYDYDNYAETITGYTGGLLSSKFLTNRPRAPFPFLGLTYTEPYNYYSLNDIATVDILVNPEPPALVNYMYVQVFSGDNTSFKGYLISLSSYTDSFSSSTDWKRYSFGVGPWNINQIPNSAIIVAETPAPHTTMITDATNFYRVDFYSGNTVDDILFGRIMTECLIFNRKCSEYTYYELIWLNKWGAFDYYPVTGNYEDAINVTKTMFERKRESVINANNYGFSPIDRGFVDFNVKSTQTIKLNTNWLTLAESEWLQEVFESPQVYLYNPALGTPNSPTALFPVNVMDTQIVLPNERSRMKAFTINVQVSTRRINQKN